jgi:DNA-binding NarL/FixJ family response regulator
MKYTVAIIEDQTLFRHMMVNLVKHSDDYEFVGEAENGMSGLQICTDHKPALVLLDLHLPDINGIELGKRILADSPKSQVLAITSLTDGYTTNSVFEAGFAGYLEKNQPLDILTEAMLTVAEGGFFFTQRLQENRRLIRNDPNAFQKILSPKEIDILRHVSKGLASTDIGEVMTLSKRTVENHRHRIMKKLRIKNSSSLIKFAIDNHIT